MKIKIKDYHSNLEYVIYSDDDDIVFRGSFDTSGDMLNYIFELNLPLRGMAHAEVSALIEKLRQEYLSELRDYELERESEMLSRGEITQEDFDSLVHVIDTVMSPKIEYYVIGLWEDANR